MMEDMDDPIVAGMMPNMVAMPGGVLFLVRDEKSECPDCHRVTWIGLNSGKCPDCYMVAYHSDYSS